MVYSIPGGFQLNSSLFINQLIEQKSIMAMLQAQFSGSNIFIIFIILAFSSPINTLEMSEVWESSCVSPEVSKDFNMTWFLSIPRWHKLMWNKAQILKITQQFFNPEQFKALTQTDIMERACYFIGRANEKGEVTMFGWEDSYVHFNVYPSIARPGVLDWTVGPSRKYIGTSYIVLTDNEEYFVSVTIWSNGLKGFSVGTKSPTLSREKRREILDHVVRIGFDARMIINYSYENCSFP